MSAYLEFHIKGNRRAFIEAGSIAGVVTAPDVGIWAISSKDAPLVVILRAGETLEVVGESAAKVLARAQTIRKQAREQALEVVVDFLEALDGAPVEE